MKIKMNIEDLTLRGQLSNIRYGDNLEWTSLNDKELKEDFIKTLNYYEERKQFLNSEEKRYLEQLKEIRLKVYGNKGEI